MCAAQVEAEPFVLVAYLADGMKDLAKSYRFLNHSGFAWVAHFHVSLKAPGVADATVTL
jgi:hypothetical protein